MFIRACARGGRPDRDVNGPGEYSRIVTTSRRTSNEKTGPVQTLRFISAAKQVGLPIVLSCKPRLSERLTGEFAAGGSGAGESGGGPARSGAAAKSANAVPGWCRARPAQSPRHRRLRRTAEAHHRDAPGGPPRPYSRGGRPASVSGLVADGMAALRNRRGGGGRRRPRRPAGRRSGDGQPAKPGCGGGDRPRRASSPHGRFGPCRPDESCPCPC